MGCFTIYLLPHIIDVLEKKKLGMRDVVAGVSSRFASVPTSKMCPSSFPIVLLFVLACFCLFPGFCFVLRAVLLRLRILSPLELLSCDRCLLLFVDLSLCGAAFPFSVLLLFAVRFFGLLVKNNSMQTRRLGRLY